MATEISLDFIDGQYCLLYNWPPNISFSKIKQFFRSLKTPYISQLNGFVITYHYAKEFQNEISEELNVCYEIPFSNIYNDLFWFNSAFKNCPINDKILKSWQLSGLQKCSSNPMRFLLTHRWGQGKTVISLLIAKNFNDSDLLIIVAPKILHLFWQIHVNQYYSRHSVCDEIQNIIQSRWDTNFEKKVVIMDESKMPLLQKLPSFLKNFIIIDDIHLVQDKNLLYSRQFSKGLGLTSFPQKYQLLLLNFLCLKTQVSFINSRYSQKKHEYQKLCIVRSYCLNDSHVQNYEFRKKIYVECRQRYKSQNKSLQFALKNIDCSDPQSCYYFDVQLFREIVFEFKQPKIRSYIQYCLRNIDVPRIFYYYSTFLDIEFTDKKKFNELGKNIEYVNLSKVNKENLVFDDNYVHTFLEVLVEEAILEKIGENKKIQFLIATNTSEEKILDKSLENVEKAKQRKPCLKGNKTSVTIDSKKVNFIL